MMMSPLYSELRSLASRRLGSVIGTLLDQVDDALFDLASHTAGKSDQQDYLDAMREVRRERCNIEQRFTHALARGFAALQCHGPTDADSDSGLSLSLVEGDALEEQLAAERIAAAAERRHGASLQRFEAGLRKVLSRESLEAKDNPITPQSLAQNFNQAMAPVDLSAAARLVTMKLFERLLVAEYGGLLEILCTCLQSHGIELPARSETVKRAASASAAANPANGAGSTHRQSGAAAPAGAVESGAESVDALYAVMASLFANYFGLQGGAEAGDGAVLGSPNAAALAGVLAGARPSGGPDSMLLDPRGALETLNQMQRALPSGLLRAVSDRQIELSAVLQQEVLQAAQQLGLARPGVRLASATEQALTLVGMLFDLLLDQGHFTAQSRRQLVRAAVPYAKVALLDQQLFAHRTHPARRLLNALAEACDGNRGESKTDRELLLRVDVMINRLLKEFDQDTALFAELDSRFAVVRQQHEKRAVLAERRAADSLRGKERLEEARLTASLELASLTSGQTAPDAIAEFLRTDWTHHLTLVLLREGEDSDSYRRARQIGIDLWLALRGCEHGAPVPDDLRQSLQPVCASTGRDCADEVLAALSAVHPATAEPTPLQRSVSAAPALLPATAAATANAPAETGAAFEVVSARTAPTDANPEALGDLRLRIDSRAVPPEALTQVRALQLGSWVDLVDAEGVGQPAKLSWISPISQKLLFVNRSGSRLCLLAPLEAAALVAHGSLIPRGVAPAFDRAIVNVLDKMRALHAPPPERIPQLVS